MEKRINEFLTDKSVEDAAKSISSKKDLYCTQTMQ